jgi:hypothetical protein
MRKNISAIRRLIGQRCRITQAEKRPLKTLTSVLVAT